MQMGVIKKSYTGNYWKEKKGKYPTPLPVFRFWFRFVSQAVTRVVLALWSN